MGESTLAAPGVCRWDVPGEHGVPRWHTWCRSCDGEVAYDPIDLYPAWFHVRGGSRICPA
ncbi:MAG: hypothetical protein M0T79_02690 [Actinomycetota bacterium]|jgi:hypothetical protein|nr:hypothetical protein [Actinomycetota bacterium]